MPLLSRRGDALLRAVSRFISTPRLRPNRRRQECRRGTLKRAPQSRASHGTSLYTLSTTYAFPFAFRILARTLITAGR